MNSSVGGGSKNSALGAPAHLTSINSDGTYSAMTWNFASGPAALPSEVLAEAREMLGRSPSLVEQPFTEPPVTAMADEAEAALRELLDLSAEQRVLFLQGGAFAHFAFVPLNLLGRRDRAEYVDSGLWGGRAIAEAKRYCHVSVLASRGPDGSLPPPARWNHDPDAAYCHLVSNETADGLWLPDFPDSDRVPLVADMSSDLLAREIDVRRFALIYASAQKNLGIAGLTVLIAKDDLPGAARPETPTVFDYRLQLRERGRINTPPVFAIAVAGMMFRWLLRHGGVAAAARRNRAKAARLYATLDGEFYRCPVAPEWRSGVNVVFRLPDPTLEARFIAEAEQNGLWHLKGHPAVGGIRASIQNAVPESAVEALVERMVEFRRTNG